MTLQDRLAIAAATLILHRPDSAMYDPRRRAWVCPWCRARLVLRQAAFARPEWEHRWSSRLWGRTRTVVR